MSGPDQNHLPPTTPHRVYPSLDSIVPRSRPRPPPSRTPSHVGRRPSSHAVSLEAASPLPSPSLGRPARGQPTTSTPLNTQPSCSICGSTVIQERTVRELQDLRKCSTDIVVSVILDVKETIGGFLVKLFDSKRQHFISPRTSSALAAFLDGHTAIGTRPADVVDSMYRHPFGTQYTSRGQPVLVPPSFPAYSIPPPTLSTTLGDLTTLSVAPVDENLYSDDSDGEIGAIGTAASASSGPEEQRRSAPEIGDELGAASHGMDDANGLGEIGDAEMEWESDAEEGGEDKQPEKVIAETVQVQSGSHSARAALQAWALSIVLHQIELESRALTTGNTLRATNSAFTWDFLFNFSLDSVQQLILSTAPFLWLAVTTAAIGAGFNTGTPPGQPRDKGGRRTNRRNPWLACVIIILVLTYFRNRECNLFPAIMGTFLFACRANSAVYAILGRCGITTSYSSTLHRLHSLGQSALSLLHDLASSPTESFLLLYDNINKQKKVWRHQLGLKDSVKSGTAATAVVLEDVEPDAFEAEPYYERVRQGLRQQLTVQTLVDDIRQDHHSNVAAANVAFILTKYIPALRRHRPFVNHLISERFAVHRLRLRKSRYYPMSTSGLDEATTAGNIKILFDLVVTQMKLAPSRLHRRLILVCGDLMTISRLRTVKMNTKANIGEYDKHSWVLPMAQLWHLKWAFLKGIIKCHWAPQSGKQIFGLRRDAEALGRSINPKQCDFYPTHRLVEVVYESMVLHCARLLIREMLPPSTPTSSSNMQLLEELSFHFGPTGHFNAEHLSEDDLFSLAVQLARRFTSNAALGDTEGMGFRSPLVYGNGPLSQRSVLEEDMIMGGSKGTVSEETDSTPVTSGEENSEDEAEAVDLRNLDPEGWRGDRVLYNTTLFMINASWYYELHAATEDGDTGRIFEVLKLLRFFFWGSGAHNYGNELLHLACGFLYEFPDKLKNAILNNYLVNPSGLPGRWHPHDLLQEHQNFAIKRVFPDQDTDFDSQFLREVVAPNIASFGYLREGLYRLFGLFHGGNKKTVTDCAADINILGAHYLHDNVHVFCPGRRQPFASVDAFSRGFQKLEGGQLEVFLGRATEG